MKNLFLTSTFFALFLLMVSSPKNLNAQQGSTHSQWIGLHNMYFQNANESTVDTMLSPTRILTQVDKERAFSLGLHYRRINEKRIYQQFDVFAFDLAIKEDFLMTEIPSQNVIEPTRGTEVKTTNIRLGYQYGKMFSLVNRLTADAGLGGYPTYLRSSTLPRTSAGFPRRETRLGFGLNIHLGLNYQVFKNINIGYSFVPATAQWFWYEERIENPILTENQKISREARLETTAFESVLDFRNIRISYTFN